MTFFMGMQYVGTDGLPRATMRSQKVILSLDDQTKLWDVVTSDGFSTVPSTDSGQGGYYLATGKVLNEMGCAWVHSRENNGATKVSTQRLVVVSDILPQYQSYQAMKAAADSYGGINKNAVYLNPQSSLATLAGGATSQNSGSTSGTEDQSGGASSGTETGGGSSQGDGQPSEGGDPNTGGNSGGDGGDGDNGDNGDGDTDMN